MQSVKLFMRAIGNPNPALGIVSALEAEEAMEYQYLSMGYELKESHYLGDVRDETGSQGYRMMFVLVKPDNGNEKAVNDIIGSEKVKAKSK